MSNFKRQNCNLAIYDNFNCQNISLKQSHICAKMNGFFGFLLVYKHTCSSHVVTKLGAVCFAQMKGIKDPIKHFSVASKVTSGIDHSHLDPMSICLKSECF